MSTNTLEGHNSGRMQNVHVCVRLWLPYWIMSKVKLNFQRSQILTDSHENRHRVYSDQYAQKLFDGFFNFNFVCMLQPIEINGEGGDFDVSSYLKNTLAKQNQIAWHASRLCPKCRKQIWCHFVSRGRYN